jgi:serine protease Do
MIVVKYAALAGAMAVALGGGPARALAQDRDGIARLVEAARGTRIGLSVSDIEGGDAKQPKAGVIVDAVTPDGPADKAGIKTGDAITEFDGERVRSVRQFSRLVSESSPDRGVPVTLSRAGQRVNVTVTPERRSRSDEYSTLLDFPRAVRVPTPPAAPRAPRPPALMPEFDFDRGTVRLYNPRGLGITMESLDDQLAEYFGVKEGALVKSVRADSAAQKAGLKAGDVITSFNGSKIYDSSDVSRAVNRLEASGEFTIEVMRDKKPQTLKGKLEGETRRGTRVSMF